MLFWSLVMNLINELLQIAGCELLDEEELNETKPARFNQHLDNYNDSFATISAERRNDDVRARFNYKTGDDSPENKKHKQRYAAFNNKRTTYLYDLLNKMGLKGYIKSKGGFQELSKTKKTNEIEEENSVFVPNITLEQAIRLGKLFNQDAIFFKPKNSDKIEEYRTNANYKDIDNTDVGSKTGSTYICCQGRTNSCQDKIYYTRPATSKTKFSFNPKDERNTPRKLTGFK